MGVPTPPDGRVLIALDDPTLEWEPTWTRLDNHPHLVTSYTIDRGRQYELDRTDVGRAVVTIADQTGLLDPTNISGPYYGKLEPLLQVMLGRQNPMDGTWYTRYRGFIEDFDYVVDPSQKVGRLELSLVDLFEILAAVEMQDNSFSDFTSARPSASLGQVFLEDRDMDDRINDLLGKALIPVDYAVTFTGETHLWEAVYSPGESPMTAIQEAVDGDWPGVSNLFCDRRGRICAHGRLSKFDPVGVKNGDYSGGTRLDDGIWDFRQWKAGDGTAVALDPTHVAHIRELAYNRGLSKIINSAYATPTRAASGVPLTKAQIDAQLVTDTTSIGKYGIRSWSAQDLLTKRSLINTPDDDLSETRRFAQYYVENYADPQNRITSIGFRPMRPGAQGSAPLWDLLSRVDISDSVTVSASGANGVGGFSAVTFFVEGVHEEVRPLNATYDDVTLHLDLSPSAYFGNPFPS